MEIFIPSISLIISPIFILIVIILKLSAEGEVLYLQERIGYKNTKFKIIKFATMLKDSMNMGSGSITLRNDFRVTGPGKLLRKTKINELPQLINILKGDISIVGPRPLPENIEKKINISFKTKRRKILPGITGMSQINYTGKKRKLGQKIKLDLKLVDNLNLYNYFKILLIHLNVLHSLSQFVNKYSTIFSFDPVNHSSFEC